MIFNICEPEEGRFNVWKETFTDGDTGKAALFHSLFPHVLEIAQPDCTWRDSTVIGIIRTLSRIDRIFINLPVAEVRDFHYYSHVFENLGNRSIPSDHAAVRIVIQKPIGDSRANAFPSWMSKHPAFCSILKRLHDDHRYSADPFGALADFKTIIEKAKRQTVRELSRKTPDSLGAKLLTASTALRAYRNRHLGTLRRCCEAWEPVGKCFEPISCESTDFDELSEIIANLNRERLAEREAETRNFPWTQTEKDNALAKCRLGLRAWRVKKPMLCLHAVTDDDGHPLENEDESGRRLCEYWRSIFQARVEGPRHHQFENLLQYVQKALDDIRRVIDWTEF